MLIFLNFHYFLNKWGYSYNSLENSEYQMVDSLQLNVSTADFEKHLQTAH